MEGWEHAATRFGCTSDAGIQERAMRRAVATSQARHVAGIPISGVAGGGCAMNTTLVARSAGCVIAAALLAGCSAVTPGAAPPSAPTSSPADMPAPTPTLLPRENPPAGATAEFRTDFSKHVVPYREILSGGPPKDGIPALDHPRFVGVPEADRWLTADEPVIALQVGADARAYPVQILIWHESVNDTVGGVPLAVSYCPLCNTAIAFERTVHGRVLDFGTTGRLHFSNLIMYDRQTETWWQQATGLAIAGTLTGTQLVFRSAALLSWAAFKAAHPSGRVLSRDTGYHRPYGENPYTGYDTVDQRPFLFTGPATPRALPPMARVLTVTLRGDAVAYPFALLRKVHVVDDTIGRTPVVVLWTPGTSSPLDATTIAGGRDVGAATVYRRTVTGRPLTFAFARGRFIDKQTGSVWTQLGRAIRGPFAGAVLQPVVAVNHFWFSWAAFRPRARLYRL
jgi:hypothetical protein